MAQPDLIYELVNGHRKSKVMFAAVELGIIDILMQASPPGLSVEDIAKALDATLSPQSKPGENPAQIDTTQQHNPVSRDGVARLLNACASLGLVDCCSDHAEQHRRYRLTAVSQEYLATSSATSLAGYVIHSNRTVYPLFQHLEACVLGGHNGWEDAFGMSGSEMFASLYQTEESLLRFMRGMHGFAALSAREVLTAFDLSSFHQAVDLGGATGAFMSTLAQLQPSCHCTVVDMPQVIQAAERHFTKPPFLTDPAVLSRISWLALDFLKASQPDGGDAASALPHADLYVMTRILHDWDEERCLQLLRLLYGRMAPGAAVLIGEMLLLSPEEEQASGGRPGPCDALMQDLNMLVQSHGKERSFEGYRQLLALAGFHRSKVHYKRTGVYLDAVIAFK